MADVHVHLSLDRTLVARASALGSLNAVVERALLQALDPDDRARRQRWAEDHALLVEAAAGGAEELAHR